MVLQMEDFIKFSPIISVCKLMTLGVWLICTKGAWLAKCMMGTTRYCYIYKFSQYKSMKAIDPQGVTNLDPRGA